MSPPPGEKVGAPPATDGATTQIRTASQQHDSRDSNPGDRRSAPPVAVWAIGFPPDGRRHSWFAVVLCPVCRAYHGHRVGPRGGVRRAGCGQVRYRVRVRRPAASARRAA